MSISHFDLHSLRRMISLYLLKKRRKKKQKNDITELIKKKNDITVALVICCLTRITCSHEGVLLGAVVVEKED